MLRIAVFDTNILISALLWPRGNPYECLKLARSGLAESVTCDEILDEFRGKLEGKFGLTPDRSRAAVTEIRSFSRLVTITNTLKAVSADPEDNKVIECAIVGGASHIVTGDKRHLLPLRTYQDVKIVTAVEFLALVSDE